VTQALRHRRLQFGLALLLHLCVATAGAAQQPYVDPSLRPLLQADVRAVTEAALQAEPPVPERPAEHGALAFDVAGPGGTARVGAFIRVRSLLALSELRAAGVEIGAVAGDVVTARVPLLLLPVLAASTGLEHIEAAHVVERDDDLAMAAIRADQVRTLMGQAWQGWTGQGVIVGIYDTGIDFLHPDFRDAAGNTRLLGLWEQTQGSAPPPGFTYGTYCGVAVLNDGGCLQRDISGHGTHVAGLAAGNGAASPIPGQHAGVAPAVHLLVVKGGDGTFAEDRIIDGIDWMFREAARLGMPAVVNLSLGSQFGAHDGTRLYERMIDNLSGAGRIVVAAAGNEGANPSAPVQRRLIHGTALPAVGVTRQFHITVPQYTPSPAVNGNRIQITFWYGGADRLRIAVVRPDGSRLSVDHGQVQQSPSAAGGIHIDNASAGPNPQNGDNEVFIAIQNFAGAGPPAQGGWTLEVTPITLGAARRYHFWIYSNTVNATGHAPGFTNSHLINSPGTAHRVVTVGAFVTRTSWRSIDGNMYSFAGPPEVVGDIATFSSPGPTRDGRVKPEVTAPGRVIVSSLSRHAEVPAPRTVPGGFHHVLQGTSMASPIVAGAIALLLQREPGLTPEQVKQVIQSTTIRDNFTRNTYVPDDAPGIPNFTWGYGKLNVAAAVEAAAQFAQASVLAVAVNTIQPAAPPLARRGTRVPLLSVALTADGPEALRVTRLGFDVTDADPDARLVLIRDVNGDGQAGPQDPLLSSMPVALQPADTARVLFPLSVAVPAGQTVHLLLALELSGAAPHQAPLRAWFVPAESQVLSAATGQPRGLRQPTGRVASETVRTTLLFPDEPLALSENPVRSDRLIISFRTEPRRAAIYTVSGRRVVDLLPRLVDRVRVEWDLTNEQGAPVAPGVYLAIFEVGNEVIRERLIITRPAGGRQ
jgi:subtilisin family serine protease